MKSMINDRPDFSVCRDFVGDFVALLKTVEQIFS